MEYHEYQEYLEGKMWEYHADSMSAVADQAYQAWIEDKICTKKDREERKLAGCTIKSDCQCRLCQDEFPAFLEAWN